MRDTFPAECMGEQCPNYSVEKCNNSRWEWITAKTTVKEEDISKPPLKESTVFVTYKQVCTSGDNQNNIRYRVDDYNNGDYYQEETGLLMHGDAAFGEGVDVDVFDVQIQEDGVIIDNLRKTYEGWG